MKARSYIFNVAIGCLFLFVCIGVAAAQSVSRVMPITPYNAEADHFGGPACVQMTIKNCPGVTTPPSQADIYSSILLNNTEPTLWFSDPQGIRGALHDPTLSSCGSWIIHDDTDKSKVLGSMLYWMNRNYNNSKYYLTPVLINGSEYWVNVFGFQSDPEPLTSSATVTLEYIYYYDPNPGICGIYVKSGYLWETDSDYWGVPLSKSTSAWDGQYVAVIEPPLVNIVVIFPRWIKEGVILSIDVIERRVRRWFEDFRRKEIPPGPLEVLRDIPRMKKPVLVKAEDYSYYLVTFEDRRMAAVVNAYNGTFEEFVRFEKPRRFLLDRGTINAELNNKIRGYNAKAERISDPELRYDPKLARAGRFSPITRVETMVRDAKGESLKMEVIMSPEGRVVRGLERFEKLPMKKQLR